MEIKNLFYISSLALLAWSCKEDVAVNPITPTPGKEVVFGVSLKPETRTEYGELTNNAYPVYWVDGDQIEIISPNQDISQATYKITTKGNQSNADAVDKVTPAGIQWGKEPKANFFSVYPAQKVESTDPAQNIITMRMPHIQNDVVSGTTSTADMNAAILYGNKIGANNGETVNLSFSPLATALRFTVQGPHAAGSVTIQSIKLIAPMQIAGVYDLKFDNATGIPSFETKTPDGKDYHNEIIIYSRYQNGGYLTLSNGQSIKLNAFIMLNSETTITNDWKIEISTLNKTFTKSLGGAPADGGSMTILPGQIHTLPTLPTLDADNLANWDVTNWIENIPRNTYLTEISLPGSWNSMNKDFQIGTGSGDNEVVTLSDLQAQYANGARAFHLDTRWRGTRSSGQKYAISDLGIANGGDTYSASTGSGSPTIASKGKIMSKISSNTTFADALSTISGLVKDNEFMYLICTFAQGSASKVGQTWYDAISTECAKYDNIIMGSQIKPETIVRDVLGKLIVIVNMEDGDLAATSLPSGSKCLFVEAPLTLTSEMFATEGNYNMNPLYYVNGSAGQKTGITMFVSQAQIQSSTGSPITQGDRGYIPTQEQRMAQLNAIISWSETNYGKADFDTSNLMLLGLGGYSGYYSSGFIGVGSDIKDEAPSGSGYSNAYEYIAGTYNSWIYNKVTSMTPETKYYPVGIVLMNNVSNKTNYNGSTINAVNTMKEILLLNNRYELQFDKTKPAWPETKAVQSVSKNHASGFKVNSDSWTVF